MARARNLKPGFFTNDRLGELEPLARLLFQGLWCHADREGRLENRPKKLKAEILPYDDCDVPNLLLQLAAAEFIICYVVENNQYIQIINFSKHQNPHPREQASTIPAVESREKPRLEISRQEPAVEKPEPARPLPSSPIPLPSNPYPSSSTRQAAAPRAKRAVLDAGKLKIFEEWYAIYPLHKARLAAERAFLGALARASPAELLAGAARYRDECAGKEARYIAHPATWLNQGRWKDENGRLNGSASLYDISQRRRPTAPPAAEDIADVGS